MQVTPTSVQRHPAAPDSEMGVALLEGAIAPAGSACSAGQQHHQPEGPAYSTATVAKTFLSTSSLAQLALRGQTQPTPSRMAHYEANVDPATRRTVLPISDANVGFTCSSRISMP